MSDIAQLMRAANPVPDSEAALTNDDFDALLLLTQSRSGNVDVQDLTKPVEPEKKKQFSGWLVAAAAFAVVIVFLGAAMLLRSPADELPPATTPPTTQAAVEESVDEATATTVAPVVEAEPVMTDEILALLTNYEAAFNNADDAAFRALYRPGAVMVDEDNPGLNVSLDKLVAQMMDLRRQESSLALEDCAATSYGALCNFVYSGAVETALFLGPLTETYALHIDRGQITELGWRSWTVGPNEDPWQHVRDWVEENFPEDRKNMLDSKDVFVLASEDSELWLKYAPLWAEAGRP